MGRLLPIAQHLTQTELMQRYQNCKHAGEKIYWQAILLRFQGRNTTEVAAICGWNSNWVRRLVQRYNKGGPDAFFDLRRNNGRAKLLTNEQQQELHDMVLHQKPPDGGLWSGPKVAQWMSVKLGRPIRPNVAWCYLRNLNLTKQYPRPRHAGANPLLQEEFKKKLEEHMIQMRQRYPGSCVELWAQDEARIGLVPIMRRVWAQRGKQPIAIGRRRYEWTYVYGFVQPSTGRVEWLLLPTVNNELFSLSLQHLAQATRAGAKKQVVVVVDQAGFHTAKNLAVPLGIHLYPLPAYSPELQPAERLWPLIREAVANQLITDMDVLENLLIKRCNELSQNAEAIHRQTLFAWWDDASRHEVLQH